MVWVDESMGRGCVTPLCPAGHLPHRWGDWLGAAARSDINVWMGSKPRVDLPPCGGDARQGRGGYHTHQPSKPDRDPSQQTPKS